MENLKRLEVKTEKKIFCNLVSYALFDKPFELSGKIDWNKIYSELEVHSILGLFSDKLESLPIPSEIKNKWNKKIFENYLFGLEIRKAQLELVHLLEGEKVPFAIIKGTAAAMYYPEPDMRTMGDVDFLVDDSNYIKAQKILDNNGYSHSIESENNVRHKSFNKNHIEFECHHRFADPGRKEHRIIDSYLTGAINRAETYEYELGYFPVLPTIENGIALMEHVALHLVFGLGMRQIIDWMMYVDRCLSDEVWTKKALEVYKKLGLETLAKATTRMCQIYFGLTDDIHWCNDVDEKVCERLFNKVYSYGNFGKKAPLDNKVVTIMHESKKGFFMNLKTAGEYNWKALDKHPNLKPLAPVYQIGRYLRQLVTTKGAVKDLSKKIRKTNELDDLLSDLDLL